MAEKEQSAEQTVQGKKAVMQAGMGQFRFVETQFLWVLFRLVLFRLAQFLWALFQ